MWWAVGCPLLNIVFCALLAACPLHVHLWGLQWWVWLLWMNLPSAVHAGMLSLSTAYATIGERGVCGGGLHILWSYLYINNLNWLLYWIWLKIVVYFGASADLTTGLGEGWRAKVSVGLCLSGGMFQPSYSQVPVIFKRINRLVWYKSV